MLISHIKLENWRNFAKVDVNLTLRQFLIGANASGKSNFLDAIRFLRELVIPGGGFQKAVIDRGGVSKIRCLAARQHSDVTIEVELSSQEAAPSSNWRYQIRFNQDNNRKPILKTEVVWKDNKEILGRPDDEDNSDKARLSQTALEQVNENSKFRDVWNFFTSIRYLHLVPQVIRKPAYYAASSIKDDPFGSDFLERLANTNERTRNARLKRILSALKLAVPQLVELELKHDPIRGTPHLSGKYEHWRLHPAEQSEEEFSDGTLRMIGLLWSLFEGEGPLLLEEPELSLHAGIVKRLAPLIYRIQKERRRHPRQVMISTHSLELLADSGIGGEETLLLMPKKEGTDVQAASSIKDIREALLSGLTVAEAAIPRTEPKNANQLSFWR